PDGLRSSPPRRSSVHGNTVIVPGHEVEHVVVAVPTLLRPLLKRDQTIHTFFGVLGQKGASSFWDVSGKEPPPLFCRADGRWPGREPGPARWPKSAIPVRLR